MSSPIKKTAKEASRLLDNMSSSIKNTAKEASRLLEPVPDDNPKDAEPRERLLFCLPKWARFICAALWMVSLALNIYSLVPSTAFLLLSAAPEPLAMALCDGEPAPCEFSITHTMGLLISSDMWFLAIILICFSICFPPVKLLWILVLAITPTTRRTRVKSMGYLGQAGRVSLLDIFFMLILMIAFCDQGRTISPQPPWSNTTVASFFFGTGTSVASGTFTFAFAIVASLTAVAIVEVFVVYDSGEGTLEKPTEPATKTAFLLESAPATLREFLLHPPTRTRWAQVAVLFALAGIPLVICSFCTTLFTIDRFGSVITDAARDSLVNVSVPSLDQVPQWIIHAMADKTNTTIDAWFADNMPVTMCKNRLAAKTAEAQIAAAILAGNGIPGILDVSCFPAPIYWPKMIVKSVRAEVEKLKAIGEAALEHAKILISDTLRSIHILRRNAWSLATALSALGVSVDGNPQPAMYFFMAFLIVFLVVVPCAFFCAVLGLFLVPLDAAQQTFWLRAAKLMSTFCFLEVLWLGVILYIVQESHLIVLDLGPAYWCMTAYVIIHPTVLWSTRAAFAQLDE